MHSNHSFFYRRLPVSAQNKMNRASYKRELSSVLSARVDEIFVFDVIDSTNAEALRRLKTSYADTLLLTAFAQTAGRGRLGRKWHSPKGAGLYLSLVKNFPRELEGLQALSLVTALSVRESLSSLGAEGIELKWPNDLLVGKAKLGGILLESRLQKESVAIVFGMGLNLQLSEEAKAEIDREAIDLQALLPVMVEPVALIANSVSRLMDNIEIFEREGFSHFQSQWNAADRYLEQDVVIQSAERKFIGRCLGVDDSGALLLRTVSGVARITGGEIFPSVRRLGES